VLNVISYYIAHGLLFTDHVYVVKLMGQCVLTNDGHS